MVALFTSRDRDRSQQIRKLFTLERIPNSEGLLDLDASLIDRSRRQIERAESQRDGDFTVGIRHDHDGERDVW